MTPTSVTMRVVFLLVLLLAVAALPREAVSQPASAQAEVLFREGKKLMAEGNITAACEAFDGSYKKDASPSTLMNLADCREKNQQYASAWAHYVETARLSRANPSLEALGKVASERAAQAEKRLSFLIINVPDESRVEGLSITRNGVPVEAVEWNRDIPVDGGTYVIEAKAPAYEAWSAEVTVGNAKDKQSVNVPRFREALGESETRSPRETGSRFTGKRKLGLALGAVGVVAFGSSLAFELKSGGTYDDAKTSMDNAERRELTDQANRERDIAMVLGSVGLVAVGAGAVLWITGRAPEHSIALAPSASPHSVTMTVTGSF